MATAVEHADRVHDNWSEHAYTLFLLFLKGIPTSRRFMTEQVRQFAYLNGLPFPPSERSWGSITARLKKEKKIIWCGTARVTNVKAHQANASTWRKL